MCASERDLCHGPYMGRKYRDRSDYPPTWTPLVLWSQGLRRGDYLLDYYVGTYAHLIIRQLPSYMLRIKHVLILAHVQSRLAENGCLPRA